MDEITLVDVPAQQVLGMRRRGRYTLIPEMLMTIITHAIANGIAIAGPPVFLCHETSPEDVKAANEAGTADVEVAWPVAGPVKGTGEIRAYTLPGGKMARIVHHGPYEACEPTYQRLFAWISAKRLSISGPIREIYLNDPREVPPEQILTEILAPVG
ncbi:MAG: GyrI-like domain-containing protein [Methanomicrobiales archaeon]|nr:GyrI-like domain-containing protein [Methanomicrobiales archaeon]MDD1654089.1 GyrI-like domain-containing protein [Methanomicrobiales archaeon]